MRVHVALTPDEAGEAPTGIVIDVIRATSTICQALAAGYEKVLCTAEIDEARALGEEIGDAVLGGERNNVVISGFDLGNSPREYLEPRSGTLILTTTNGTRAIVSAARRCERVFVASLLNLDAVVQAARDAQDDVLVICAGVQGTLALDVAYVAGRLVTTWSGADEAFRASKSGRNLLENAPELEDDIAFCARESVLEVVPRLAGMRGSAAEIVV